MFAATNFLCCTYLVVYGVISLLLPNPNFVYLLLFLTVLIADLWVLVLAFSVRKQVGRNDVTPQKSEVKSLMDNESSADED